MPGYRIERSRKNLATWREVPQALQAGEGEIVARIDIAALTANNVTYAVHGGAPLFYWNFFPASDADWGVVPVWGFATVTESRVADIPVGARFYGYWPSATHLKLQPGPLKSGGFTDMAPHRQGLAAVYNSYVPTGPENPGDEALAALFRPLYGTGFVLAHTLAADAAASRRIILTSASSKTALATAFNLKAKGAAPVGLTSRANLAFVKSTGLYADVLPYEAVETLDAAVPTVLVDFSGNGTLKTRLHAHLTGLTASHIVGDTDWASPKVAPLTGPEPVLFFAPSAWEARAREIGPAAFEAEMAASMQAFLAETPQWLKVETLDGVAGYAQGFAGLMANRSAADTGLVWNP